MHAKVGQLPATVHDNFFVLTGVLKDLFGELLSEEHPPPLLHQEPSTTACPACRRMALSVALTKIF